MIGLVIGSAKCIDRELTKKLLPYCKSVAINMAASLFHADYASTSEKSAFNNWSSLGNKCRNLLVHKSCVKSGYEFSDKIETEDNNLLFYGHGNSALPAINFLIKQKCDKIILSGITFEPQWNYVNLDLGKYHDPSHCELIRQDLYLFFKYVKLYCINQNTFDPKYITTLTPGEIEFSHNGISLKK